LWSSWTQFCVSECSMNVIMYVISGSRFRNEILSLLLCKGRARMQTFTSTSGDGSGRRQIDTNIDSVSSKWIDLPLNGRNSCTSTLIELITK
jgi:hypothetical protein